MKVREIPRAKNEEESKNSKREMTLQQLGRAEKDILRGLVLLPTERKKLRSWAYARWGIGQRP